MLGEVLRIVVPDVVLETSDIAFHLDPVVRIRADETPLGMPGQAEGRVRPATVVEPPAEVHDLPLTLFRNREARERIVIYSALLEWLLRGGPSDVGIRNSK